MFSVAIILTLTILHTPSYVFNDRISLRIQCVLRPKALFLTLRMTCWKRLLHHIYRVCAVGLLLIIKININREISRGCRRCVSRITLSFTKRCRQNLLDVTNVWVKREQWDKEPLHWTRASVFKRIASGVYMKTEVSIWTENSYTFVD